MRASLDPASTERAPGRSLRQRYCATCYGDVGENDGPNASNLNPPVPDLTSSKSLADAAYVRRVIAEGSAAVGTGGDSGPGSPEPRAPVAPTWGRPTIPLREARPAPGPNRLARGMGGEAGGGVR